MKVELGIDTDEDMTALYKAIGFIVIQFGQAEQSLDLAVATLYQGADSASRPKKIPKMLEPKLRFVRERIQSDASLESLRQLSHSLTADFERISDARNDIIHGAIASVSAVEGVFKYVKLEIKDGFHHVREFDLDLKEFPAIADDLIKLGADAIEFAQRLHRMASSAA